MGHGHSIRVRQWTWGTGGNRDDTISRLATARKRQNTRLPYCYNSSPGQSVGIPAAGELEGSSYNPMGDPGVRHWQASQISRPGLDERGNIFFAAIEMTRMPMVLTDPNQPDNPIVFVNRAFLDLTQYREDEVLGRNCRMLQGEQTDPNTVAELR